MKAKLKTLKNGLRIITVPMKDNPTATVMVMVEAGTRYETKENNGLSHFLEHMCFKGTQKRNSKQIAYELEAMGAITNAFTWYDYTGYYAKGKSELYKKLLDVVADVYLNSTFPKEEIEKERGVICGEIDMYEDMPMQRVQEFFAESLYGDQPAGYTILGPKENIKSFTQDDFLNYHRTHYIAEKTIIVITGDIDTKEAEREVEKQFATISSGPRKEKKKITKQTGERLLFKEKETDQVHLTVGLRTVPMQHPDARALGVLVGILGNGMSSRLFLRLREDMGAGYYVRARFPRGNDYGEFEVSTGTEPKRVKEVLTAIKEECQKLCKEKVSDEELNKTKTYLLGNLFIGMESSDDVASHFADQAILHQPLKSPKEIEKEIRNITAQDVLRVAKKYLRFDKMHLALIGPNKDKGDIGSVFGA